MKGAGSVTGVWKIFATPAGHISKLCFCSGSLCFGYFLKLWKLSVLDLSHTHVLVIRNYWKTAWMFFCTLNSVIRQDFFSSIKFSLSASMEQSAPGNICDFCTADWQMTKGAGSHNWHLDWERSAAKYPSLPFHLWNILLYFGQIFQLWKELFGETKTGETEEWKIGERSKVHKIELKNWEYNFEEVETNDPKSLVGKWNSWPPALIVRIHTDKDIDWHIS